MADVFSAPLWIVALVIAAAAPFCVRALQTVLETRLRRRTAVVVDRARSPAPLPDLPSETQKTG